MAIQVSVITPAYNTVDYLEQTIASVAAQVGVSFEHIIIDDCSTDATAQMIHDAAEQHDHIRAIFQDENQGQARARNRGLDEAQGEFVAFLDSDDLLNGTDALGRWYRAAKDGDADLAGGHYRIFLDGKPDVPAAHPVVDAPVHGQTIATLPGLVNYTSCWQFLARRAFLDDHGIRFSKRLRQREDRPFFTQALSAASRVTCVPDELVQYRVREGSTMRSVDTAQMSLFAIHLQIVNDAMRGLMARGDAQDYLAANQLYYLQNIDRYWGKLFADPSVRADPAFAAFIAACGCFDWDERATTTEQVLFKPRDARLHSGYYDALRLVLLAQMPDALVDLVQTRNLSLPRRQALYEWLAHGVPSSATTAARKTQLDRFLRRTPLPAVTKAEANGLAPVSDMPKVFLHCGQTKTGSSALQKFFELNRFALLRDHGVYYPYAGLEMGSGPRAHRTSGHAGLIGGLLNGSRAGLDQLRLEVASLTTPPQAVFLSVENILSTRFWGDGDAAAKLAKALAGLDVTLVCYMRRQDEWLESMYVESITSPGMRETASVEAFVEEQMGQGLLSYDHVAATLREAFPNAPITFRSYELSKAKAGGTVRDFLEVIGLSGCDPDAYEKPSRKARNRSTSKLAALLIRKANAVPLPRAKVLQINASIVEMTPDDLNEGKAVGFLDHQQRATIMARLKQSNEAFYGAYLPDAIHVSMAPARNVSSLEDDTALTGDALARLQALLADPVYSPAATTAAPEGKKLSLLTPELWSLVGFALHPRRLWGVLRRPMLRQQLKEAVVIARSGLFDVGYYEKAHPDAVGFPGGAVLHYVTRGVANGYDPAPGFSTSSYRLENADVASAGVNPFYHFIRWGQIEGRPAGVDEEVLEQQTELGSS
ncbi:glycosyltransferase family 2 protein [uncultured Aliiroseovarius sp.]|uniref:glycosyltransferase family 2 protein n=1 Tax=uncultured Aliiroseovarius sp. TaxID=1658783 RepID=UPI002612FE31|nr:glycosyltransferase family 2 protein [uncultured Aliiroseovarius sp.]